LMRFHGDRLLIHAAVIMPTHVHALIEPLPLTMAGKNACPTLPYHKLSAGKNACPTLPYHKLSDLLHGIKGASARAASKILGTTGTAFWMDESYDHIERNEKQYRHFLHYIQENPVKARLPSDEYWIAFNVATQGEAGIPACQDAQTPNVGQAFLPAVSDTHAPNVGQAFLPASTCCWKTRMSWRGCGPIRARFWTASRSPSFSTRCRTRPSCSPTCAPESTGIRSAKGSGCSQARRRRR
ncbi:MAG: hypothetical protein PHG71_04930, partial [Kiritimatiellae bacterium]|nr:hypothetical protein [Kiritimatiellia bacterium]